MKRIISLITVVILCCSLVFITPLPVKAATNYEGSYYFVSALGDNLALDVKGGNTANRTNVRIYKRNGTGAQKFEIQKVGNYYRIINKNSGKVLDVASGSKNNKANIYIYKWQNTKSQLWRIQSFGNGYVRFINVASGKALSVAGNKKKSGTNVYQYTPKTSYKGQKWKLVATMTKQTKQTSGVTSGTIYTIRSAVNKNYALDVKSGSKKSGANVQLYNFNNSAAQLWKLTWSNGYYKITNVGSGKVLDVAGGKTANGTNVRQFVGNNTRAQRWKILKNNDGTYSLISALSDNIALDLKGGKASNGRNIQIYQNNKTSAQKWYELNIRIHGKGYIRPFITTQ